MTEAERYFNEKLRSKYNTKDVYISPTDIADFAKDFADEQVRKAMSKVLVDNNEIYQRGVKHALEEIEKSLLSDEEIHDVSMKFERTSITGLEPYIDYNIANGYKVQRNRTQEAINKLKKG